MNRLAPFALLVFALASSSVPEAAGAQPGTSGAPPSDGAKVAREYFPDALLVDQRGEELRFQTDLLEGKVVVIGAVSSDCKEHCAATLRAWTKAQKALGARMGSAVHFLTLASDVERDTPDRMRGLAAANQAGKGWYFLTGSPGALRLVLAKLDLAPREDGSHATTWVIANVVTGLWSLTPDTLSSEQLVDAVKTSLQDE